MGRNGPQQFDEANCDNSNILSGTVNHNRFSTHALLTTKIKYEKAPQMSVSGFAFAVVAASIPLLRLQDVEYTSNVLKVVRCMIPFILEPEELIQFQYDQMQLSTRTKNDFEGKIVCVCFDRNASINTDTSAVNLFSPLVVSMCSVLYF